MVSIKIVCVHIFLKNYINIEKISVSSVNIGKNSNISVILA